MHGQSVGFLALEAACYAVMVIAGSRRNLFVTALGAGGMIGGVVGYLIWVLS